MSKVYRSLLMSGYARSVVRYMVWSMCFVWQIALANLDHDLNAFFNNVGYQSNITQPVAYHDQAAGYYSGGSIFLRHQVRTFQLMSIELPSFSAGCSGIDAFLGSFSVISSDELVQMLKNILSSAGAYAFDLALTTVLPQIKTVKDYLQKFVNDINNMNINSCATAEELVGGMWPKTQASQQQICRDNGWRSGLVADWANGRQACGTGGQFMQGIQAAGSREQETMVNKNLVWAALQHNTLMSQDHELSELLMSLSGSIIIRVDDNQHEKVSKHGKTAPNTQKIPLPSVAANQAVIKAFLHGGQAEFYACDESKHCLNPQLKKVTVDPAHGLIPQVAHLIRELDREVVSDSGTLSLKLRGLLEKTPIPILKYITNSLALGKAVNPNQFSGLIAISLLNQYFAETIRIVQDALLQEDTPMNPEMQTQLHHTQGLIAQQLSSSYRELINMDAVIHTMRADEQQLTARLLTQVLSD